MSQLYVIWSHQHSAWWRPESAGYTTQIEGAGVYSHEEALGISHSGRDGWRSGRLPDELPVRIADLPEFARTALGHSEQPSESDLAARTQTAEAFASGLIAVLQDIASICVDEDEDDHVARIFETVSCEVKPADRGAVELFLADVRAEIVHARAKFPGDNLTTIAMFEEAGEVAKAVLDEEPAAIRKECVQLASMAARITLDGDASTTKYRRERRGLGPIAQHIRTGDIVYHHPTGETWMVAWADPDTGYMAPSGWPECQAEIRDCDVLVRINDEASAELVEELSKSGRSDAQKAARIAAKWEAQ